jgi:hypothetical protein
MVTIVLPSNAPPKKEKGNYMQGRFIRKTRFSLESAKNVG